MKYILLCWYECVWKDVSCIKRSIWAEEVNLVQERGRNRSLEKIVQGEEPGRPLYRGFTITLNQTPTFGRALQDIDQPDAETSTWLNTQHSTRERRPCSRQNSTHNPSKRATADSRLRPHGHWVRSFMTVFLPKGYMGDKIKENETDGACSTCGKRKMQRGFYWGELKERDHLKRLSVDWRIILKRVLKYRMAHEKTDPPSRRPPWA